MKYTVHLRGETRCILASWTGPWQSGTFVCGASSRGGGGGILRNTREETVGKRSKFGADRECHASAEFAICSICSAGWLTYYGDKAIGLEK